MKDHQTWCVIVHHGVGSLSRTMTRSL